MNTKEKRKFERIPNDDLPVIFKNLLVDIGEHKNLNAETVDVSTTGIGVHLSLPSGILDRIDQVVLHSADNRYKFSGQIVNVMKLRENYYRLGVVLKDSQWKKISVQPRKQIVYFVLSTPHAKNVFISRISYKINTSNFTNCIFVDIIRKCHTE